jgi:hypothetical protein
MRKPSLTAAVVATGTIFLATAASALAAYAPTSVGSQSGVKTKIHVTSTKADDSTAKLTIYAPSAATLTAAVGTTIGTVTAQVNAKAISPDAILPLVGSVIVADPTNATLAATAVACTGTATHTGTWNLSLTAAGQVLNVPVFVDATAGAEVALGATKLQTCLASPDTGAACAATFCAKLLDVDFTVSGVFGASSSPLATWLTLFTPFTPGTATPNPTGTVTAVGLDAKPTITLTAKVGKGRKVAIAGRATISGQPLPGIPVPIFSGTKKIATAKTSTSGTFLVTKVMKKGSYTFHAGLAAPDLDATAQACALVPASLPHCASATIAAFAVSSKAVKVRVK